MTVNVRPPEVPDAAGIGVAHARMWLSHYGKFIEPAYLDRFDEAVLVGQWHRLLTADPGGRRIAVAVEHGRVVGIAMSVPTVRSENMALPPRQRELSMHYLMPEFQGEGLGRRLLEYVLSPHEPAQLWLPEGYDGEKRAHRFYRRAGFLSDGAVTGKEPNFGLQLSRMVRRRAELRGARLGERTASLELAAALRNSPRPYGTAALEPRTIKEPAALEPRPEKPKPQTHHKPTTHPPQTHH